MSCTSARACTATGYYLTGTAPNTAPLAERWNGTAWKIQNTPSGNVNQVNNPDNVLQGISCTSAPACMAVGNYGSNNADNFFPLAEQEHN